MLSYIVSDDIKGMGNSWARGDWARPTFTFPPLQLLRFQGNGQADKTCSRYSPSFIIVLTTGRSEPPTLTSECTVNAISIYITTKPQTYQTCWGGCMTCTTVFFNCSWNVLNAMSRLDIWLTFTVCSFALVRFADISFVCWHYLFNMELLIMKYCFGIYPTPWNLSMDLRFQKRIDKVTVDLLYIRFTYKIKDAY